MSKYCPLKDGPALYSDCIECRKEDLAICDFFFLLVAGSRSFADFEMMCDKLNNLLNGRRKVVVISGGAKGADSLAKRYARQNDFLYMEFPADWEKYGKKAGYIRNKKMHEYLSRQKEKGVVLFWDGKSPGTKQNISLAEEFHNPMRTVLFENN